MLHRDSLAVLRALFELAGSARPASTRLVARRARLSATKIADALSALGASGLVDVARLRLTMAGLALAVASRSKGGESLGSGRGDAFASGRRPVAA